MWVSKFFSKILQDKNSEGKGKNFSFKIMILLAVGAILMLSSSFCSRVQEKKPPAAVEPLSLPPASAEDKTIRELIAVLEQIRGVGAVSLFPTYESMGRSDPVVDGDETIRRTVEEDGGGGRRESIEESKRETYVILRDLQGKETPLIVEEKMPRYRGVLVVAEGVEDPAVKALVVEALRAVLDLPEHRITVLPRGE